ncbi:MAG TPA: undecaprenyl-diphosphate phosphatase [Acidimicrobiales bacterium]|nr:undecaprenyl-diphosphate phosphatase [Acidimicrobiales bacterium]
MVHASLSLHASMLAAHARLVASSASSSIPPLHISNFQAIVLGILQGVTELFPISSLGHTVIYPSLFGWHALVVSQSQPESHWLGFVVMLHVGSALGLLAYFWRDWSHIVRAWARSVVRRKIETPTEKVAWLIIVSTVPAGIIGIALEHELRVLLAKPLAAAIFLTVNGFVLFAGEGFRRRAAARVVQSEEPSAEAEGEEIEAANAMAELSFRDAVVVGIAQSTALIAGISRDGVCMTTGLARGLSQETAARFAFLLATPVILAAGVYKLPDFLGTTGAGVRVPALLGLVFAAMAAIVSVHWLVRWFKTRNLTPFAIYCVVFGLAMTIYFSVS